ncbi:MAG: hypothetical protein ACE5DO_13335 [Desulfobacterales bacterium]
MYRWHYIKSRYLYIGIHMMSTALAFSKGLSPFHIVLANPSFPLGGLSAASKVEVMDHFKTTDQYLPQVLIPQKLSLEERKIIALSFIEKTRLPVIAKPDRGVVGIGVIRIDSIENLDEILNIMPCDYMLQAYCDFPLEYAIFFCKFPDKEKGGIVSLSQKLIPFVIGDGSKTVKDLIKLNPVIKYNRNNLITHARNLDYIPKSGEKYPILVQASHTYGCVFKDRNHEITPEMEEWMNEMCSAESEFYFGRFDLKIKNKDSLKTGRGVKICELNGCWSEPIHIYDDKHSFLFAAKEIYRSYDRAYNIAKLNKKRLKRKIPYRKIITAYRSYMQEKEAIIRIVG